MGRNNRTLTCYGYTSQEVIVASYDLELNEEYTQTDIRNLKNHINESNDTGKPILKFVLCDNASQHMCKMCKENVVESTYEDLLCKECSEAYGHSKYSEL